MAIDAGREANKSTSTRTETTSSGFDFQDRNPFADPNPFIDPPDYDHAGASVQSSLYRNKSERGRLQGIQQKWVKPEPTTTQGRPRALGQKFDLWMINEGGKRLFFFTWILFHCLVIAFGFLNYHLSDDLTNARATFGITYRASVHRFRSNGGGSCFF